MLRIFQEGGLLMWPILGCSIVVLSFTLERLIMLRRTRVIPKAFVTRFIERLREGKLDRASALQLCQANGSPIAKVFAHAVQKWGRPSVEVEQAVLDGGEREMHHLRKNLRVLNGMVTVAPLLGLLGTVIGMIKAFNVIALYQGMGKTELLADGISTALLTTAGGLMVAVPAYFAYLYLISRVDALISEVDAQAQEVVSMISAEALQQPRRRPAPAPHEAEPVGSQSR
jgi:biopolymer transport protein ExbB